jgi:hypothetical protein
MCRASHDEVTEGCEHGRTGVGRTSGLVVVGMIGTARDGDPVGLGELDAPEVRRGRQEFEADALTFAGIVAQVDDAALLLFLSGRIRKRQNAAHLEGLVEIDKAAVSVDNDGLADGAEALGIAILAGHNDADTAEDSRAASFTLEGCGSRHAPMLRVEPGAVNAPRVPRLSTGALYEGTGGFLSGPCGDEAALLE